MNRMGIGIYPGSESERSALTIRSYFKGTAEGIESKRHFSMSMSSMRTCWDFAKIFTMQKGNPSTDLEKHYDGHGSICQRAWYFKREGFEFYRSRYPKWITAIISIKHPDPRFEGMKTRLDNPDAAKATGNGCR